VSELDRCLRKLAFGSRPKLGGDQIARNEDRAHAPPSPAANISGDEAMFRSQEPDDRPVFAVGPDRADDPFGFELHQPAG
jgi:hypothetical protein